MNEKALKVFLQPFAQERFGAPAEICGVQLTAIHRGVQRFDVQIKNVANANGAAWRLIGKTMRNPRRGEKTFQLMRSLWRHGFAREASDGICIPEPLAFWPEQSLLLMEEARGRKVRNLINSKGNPFYMQRLARTLAKLHCCPLIVERRLALEDQIPTERAELAEAFPELAGEIDASIAAARATRLRDEDSALVHGDFHLGQVHLEGDKAWLLDLDGVKQGDPASDVGNVLALLYAKEEQLPNLCELMAAFWEEYFSLMPASLATRVPLYLGLTLLRRACKFFREQEPEVEIKIEQMLAAAAACLRKIPTRSAIGFAEIEALLYSQAMAPTTNDNK